MFPPLRILKQQLEQGLVTSRALIEEAIARIDDPAGEGKLAFLTVDR